MKKTVLVLMLTFCLAFTALVFSVQADTALTLSVAASGGDYTTVEKALAAVEHMAKNGELNEKGVILVLTGNHTATEKNGVLFGQKTIFLPSGKKLPITVRGTDATLNMPAASVACANDYTFTDITIPFDDVATRLYAGSGSVTLGKIRMDLNGKTENKSRFYGDNFTASVFEGWDENKLSLCIEDGLLVTSMTLAEGFETGNTFAAVGSSTDFSAVIGNKTLSADDTRAKLVIDGATVGTTLARSGTNPVADSVLHLKSGSVYHLTATNKYTTPVTYTGNVTIIAEGGTYRHFIRLMQSATLEGDLSVTLKNVDLLTNEDKDDARMIEIAFSGVSVIGDVSVVMENVKADRYYGAMASKDHKVTGDISVTAKNCEFSKFFRSAFSQATVCGNVENTLENVQIGPGFRGLDDCFVLGKADEYTGKQKSVGNLTNTLKNVTFSAPTAESAMQLGSVSKCTVAGNITNTLENVTTQGKLSLYCGSSDGVIEGKITNTVKSGTFSHYLYGGSYAGTVKGGICNYVQGGTYFQEVYLGGHNCTVNNKIENHVSGGAFDTLYLFCGPRGGDVKTNLPYGIENHFTGGSFKGVWGGGINTRSGILTANVYNEISGGHFGVYNYDAKINSFAGSVRNGSHHANVDTLIRGGTFEGYVFGGAIPNQEDWGHEHNGISTLTIAGGDFRYIIDANCRWGNFKESHLYFNTEKALKSLSLAYDTRCESFISAGNTLPSVINGVITCKELIARGKAPLQILNTVQCDSFTVEAGAASPEIYGELNTKRLTTNETKIILGSKGTLNAQEVSGTVYLEQNAYWLARTYFTSPAGTRIVLSLGENAFGEATAEGGTVKGTQTAFEGASFVFDNKVSLRLYFNKEWVEQTKDSFLLNVTIGQRYLIRSARFKNLTLQDGHYTVQTDYISATELCSSITISGEGIEGRVFDLLQLAETGIRIYGKDREQSELEGLLKAFSNYAVATDNYKNQKTNPLPYESLATDTGFVGQVGFVPLVENPQITLKSKQMILDDGMRIRYILETPEALTTMQDSLLEGYSFFYNCDNVTDSIKKTWIPNGFRKGHWEIAVEVPVYPSKSRDHFRLIVAQKDDLHDALPADSTLPYTTYVSVDYIDRLDSVAQEVAGAVGSEELGEALLYYLQAGAEYYKTQPDISHVVYPDTFAAGYAREDFSPYGYDMDMYSGKFGKVVLDPMYVTCLALWDGDELSLIYSFDFRSVSNAFTTKYKNVLKTELKDLIDPNKIFFNATHDHSGPNASSMSSETVITWYETIFDDAFMMATKKAILDLAPSQLYTGKANSAQGTNFVRRYINSDGQYTGIHNIVPSSKIIAYETEADKELRTIRFEREGKKDIVYANWQGHAAHGAVYYYQFTADFVHWLREGVEQDMDCHFIYANGASGNLNFTAKMNDSPFTSPYFDQVGRSLVGTVKEAVAAEKKINSGKFKVTHIPFVATVKHESEDIVAKAKEANELLKAYKAEYGKDMPAKQIQTETGFQSKYEISHIITRAGMGETATLNIFAFSFGDVAMTFVPFEQFDTNAMQTRDGVKDLYEVTFTAAYSNGSWSYIPSAYAAPHGGYEVYSSRFVDSTGDDIAFALRDALRAMKTN